MFPEADSRLNDESVHFQKHDSGFPTFDLEFVDALLAEITTRLYATGSVAVPDVSADPALGYAAGYSNGGGMVWQLMNSDLASRFQGCAAVGKALDPEKADLYRKRLAGSGSPPAAVPVMYVHGTGEHTYRAPATLLEVLIAIRPSRSSPCQEMLDRTGIPANQPATTRLIPGSTNLTEVVVQLFQGAEAFAMATVIGGGHKLADAHDPRQSAHRHALRRHPGHCRLLAQPRRAPVADEDPAALLGVQRSQPTGVDRAAGRRARGDRRDRRRRGGHSPGGGRGRA